MPDPYPEDKREFPHPTVFDISKFIKSYLPVGLYGVDEQGNLLTKDGKNDSSDEDEIVSLPPDYKTAEQVSNMGLIDVHLFKMKGGTK